MCSRTALFLILAAWVLFNFHLKQKQRFPPSRTLLKMSLSSPSMEEFVNTFRNKFEISKDLSFQKQQQKKHTKKIEVSKATSTMCRDTVCFTEYSL